MVPPFRCDHDALRALVAALAPCRAGAQTASSAKYFGSVVGLGREEKSWDAPLAKYLERARLWGRLGIGLALAFQAYQVDIASGLRFAGQLEEPHARRPQVERQACLALLPGPRGWTSPDC